MPGMRLGHGARANAAPGDTIGAATRGGVSTITRYWLAGLLGAVLVVLVALVAAALLWVDREADYVAAEARRTGDMLARELGGRAEGLRVRLRGLSGDPGVRGCLLYTSDAADDRT